VNNPLDVIAEAATWKDWPEVLRVSRECELTEHDLVLNLVISVERGNSASLGPISYPGPITAIRKEVYATDKGGKFPDNRWPLVVSSTRKDFRLLTDSEMLAEWERQAKAMGRGAKDARP